MKKKYVTTTQTYLLTLTSTECNYLMVPIVY